MNLRSSAPSGTPECDARWELVLRIADSPRFARSARLKDFLLYVCRAALDHHNEEISEQKIGHRVFERPPDYNPNDDNIVRSHARLLRQKLEAYFAAEGANEPVILTIPKGGYVPDFVERPIDREPLPPANRPHSDRLMAVLAGAVAILSLAVALLAWSLVHARTAASGTGSPTLNSLWSQMFSDKLPTTIVVPDHTFAMLQEASGDPEDLQSYLRRSTPDSPLQRILPRFPARRYTTYDGVSTAVRVLQLAEKFHSRVVVRYARDITLRDIAPGNVVLIGRPATNLWAELFASDLNFQLYSDLADHRVICRNRSPRAGEQSEYVPRLDQGRLEAYSSIAFVPNMRGGNVLLIGGAASSSQEGAADFATNDRLLAPLAEKIGSNEAGLRHFEALLRTTTIDGMSQEPSLVAYRVIGQHAN